MSGFARKPWIIDFVLLAALWGASFLFMRLAVVEFGPWPTAALRVGVAALFLTPLLILRGQLPELRRHCKPALLFGVINSGLPFALYSYALLSITTGLSAILNATVPLFGAVIAWLWLGDKLNASRVLGLVLGFAGVVMLASDGASFKPGGTGWAVLACLLATLLYGLAANMAKRHMGGVAPLATATGSQLGATLVLALPAIWTWPASPPGLRAWAAIIAVGVACTGIAYILYFRLIAHVGPARTTAVTFLLPVFSLVYGAVFLDEHITHWMLVCGAVILCGTALSTGLIRLGRKT
jgi:drug/metabolite transporter (DMT)-like permease